MKRTNFLLIIALAFGVFSCNKEDQLPPDIGTPPTDSDPIVVNNSGEGEGMTYSLRDLKINPDVAFIDQTNATLLSTADELTAGKISLSNVSDDMAEKLSEGNAMYINQNDYLSIRRIESVRKENDTYILQTVEGALSDVFSDGTIQFSVGKEKVTSRADSPSSDIKISSEFEIDDNFICDLNALLRPAFDVSISFKKGSDKPAEISIDCGLDPTIDARFISKGAVQNVYEKDLGYLIPDEIIEMIKGYKFEYTIPVTSLIKVPVRITVDEVKVPTYIKANLLGDTDVTLSLDGSFSTKFKYTSQNGWSGDGFNLNDINISSPTPNIDNLDGELSTSLKVVIVPKIKALASLVTATGEISVGLYSESANYAGTSNDRVKGSKGEFITKGDIDVKIPLTGKIPFSLLNETKELWSFGSVKNELSLMGLEYNVTSEYRETYRTVRRYKTEFKVGYKYTMKGKQMPSKIDITYEVPTLLGKWDERSETITPENITDDSFTFTVEIPFYWKSTSLLRGEYKKESMIRNLIVNDRSDCEYTLSEEYEITRQ